MNLKSSGIRLFHQLNYHFTKVHPFINPFVGLLKFKVVAVSPKHAHKCDLDKEIRSLLNNVDLIVLVYGPSIADCLNCYLFHRFDHIL